MSRIAIIGSGISGLGAAWFLQHDHEITVFEAGSHVGGHAHTVDVAEGKRHVPVDTGFMVFNHVTYPNLTRLFRLLDVPAKPTEMSFSVQHRSRNLEYCGSSLNHLFAQRRNLLRPDFYRMLWQIDRFNREAVQALGDSATACMTLEEYVRRRGYGDDFFSLYLIPMSSAVWSTPPEKMLRFPAATLLRFFHNHGFLGLHTQHPWWTIEGGSRVYVEKLVAACHAKFVLNAPIRRVRRKNHQSIEVVSDAGTGTFDKVIFACHPPEILSILQDQVTTEEGRLLSVFKYQKNAVTLHTDERIMPATRRAWSSWNYRLQGGERTAKIRESVTAPAVSVSTHYWMNRLQGVSKERNYFVSVEGAGLIAPQCEIGRFSKEHPLFDLAAIGAQDGIANLNRAARGTTETYFAGAWQRYGFHEDGLLSALNLCRDLLCRDPWAAAMPAISS